MRSHFIRFGFILLSAAAIAAACTTAYRLDLPKDREVRVRVHPGSSFHPTDGEFTTLQLSSCPEPAQNDSGFVVAVAGARSVARNSAGDVLEIAADSVLAGTVVKIVRPRGRSYRWVIATAGGRTPPARLTIDLAGCTLFPKMTIVRLNGTAWDDVIGKVSGTTITADLDHLSIYAIAGS